MHGVLRVACEPAHPEEEALRWVWDSLTVGVLKGERGQDLGVHVWLQPLGPRITEVLSLHSLWASQGGTQQDSAVCGGVQNPEPMFGTS